MVEKFFLALDYETHAEALEKGADAVDYLFEKYGPNFVATHLGVKINEDLLTGPIPKNYRELKAKKYCSIFADKKISHGADTGRRIIERLKRLLPIDYVTVSANLGTDILREYVKIGNELGVKIIAWTIHTKTSPLDALRMYKQPLNDAIYNLTQTASEAGCDAAVMEAKMLEDERIRGLPIKKLVTGIRIEPSDKGTQQRVSSVEELKNLKSQVDYAVISSKYLGDFSRLEEVLNALK